MKCPTSLGGMNVYHCCHNMGVQVYFYQDQAFPLVLFSILLTNSFIGIIQPLKPFKDLKHVKSIKVLQKWIEILIFLWIIIKEI